MDRGAGRGRGEGRREPEGGWSWWHAGAALAGAAGLVGGLYLLNREQAQTEDTGREDSENTRTYEYTRKPDDGMDDTADIVSERDVPPLPEVSNLDSLLADIYVRYVAIKREDFELHYKVFMKIIYPLHDHMKKVDAYYGRFSKGLHFAGSHLDGLRIRKPDEFDVNIVIGLPVNLDEARAGAGESDVVIEPAHAGYVQLRAGRQYRNIMYRDGPDAAVNSQACKWLDDKNYILRSKFIQWFQAVIDKALNRFVTSDGHPAFDIDGAAYTVGKSFRGPACTLLIRNPATGFRLHVDLVPALRFPESRWLGSNKAYRDIPPHCRVGYFLVVPKANKLGATSHDEERSWRCALGNQEKKLLHNSYNLRQAIRLLKKLRDAQGMSFISSYYIKTLFLWKIVALNNPSFWQRDVATIFRVMLRELHNALVENKIRFFWNSGQNLLNFAPNHILNGYAKNLEKLLFLLQDDENYRCIVKYLLTPTEHSEYERLLMLSQFDNV